MARNVGFTLTFLTHRTINAGLSDKPLLMRQKCAAGGCVAPANKAR